MSSVMGIMFLFFSIVCLIVHVLKDKDIKDKSDIQGALKLSFILLIVGLLTFSIFNSYNQCDCKEKQECTTKAK